MTGPLLGLGLIEPFVLLGRFKGGDFLMVRPTQIRSAPNGFYALTYPCRRAQDSLDSLATFETKREDMEDDGSDELEPDLEEEPDAEPDHDDEYDFPGGRQKYIKDRQRPGGGHIWQGGRLIYRPSYDATKDQEELRKVKRQVNALAAKKRKRVKA